MMRFLSIVLLLSCTLPSLAHAQCGVFQFKCQVDRQQALKASELQSGEISSASNAATSLNQFKFQRRQDIAVIGYSQISYSMVDRKSNTYSDHFTNAKEIVQRSIFDWIKSIFRTQDKVFIVSIDVYADEAETQLIAHKPIMVIEHRDSLRAITSQNDISLNGRLGYPRLSNRTHRVKLSVRFTNTSDVSLDEIGKLLTAANKLSTIAPAVGSLVDEVTLVAFNSAKSDLEAILGKFESSTKMSRSLSMRHKKDEIVAFSYDFRAPSETELPRVKLFVGLDHQVSLLVDGGVTKAGDILNVLVHDQDDDTISLRNYLQNHDISREAVAELSTASPNVSKICRKIREALGKRLTAADQSIALNAYITETTDLFSKNWTRNNTCYLPGDIALFASIPKLEPAPLWKEAQPKEIVRLTLTEQLGFVKSLNGALTKKPAADFVEAVTDGIVAKLPEGQDILFVDKVGFLLEAEFKIDAGSLVRQLITNDRKFERGLGCYSGDQFDTDAQPNVLGTLSMYNGKPIEVLFEFSPSPSLRKRPELERLIFQRPTIERLLKYRDGEASRAKEGCAGGFKPWEQAVAETRPKTDEART